ncbi:DUF2726 domain-containing protein [Mariprofundus ferrooxydans]|uniref:DUF2726 domain-containing protein n=1 Tax=Mariprofundus ferrooxydans TaxID=314344 RepID=UPI00037D1270|nr:DUF2726 domain-containing protein [Mariprofundus ferrooxydans]
MPVQAIAVVLTVLVLLVVIYTVRTLRHDRLSSQGSRHEAAGEGGLNEMEQACLKSLTAVVGDDYRVICKVPVADLVAGNIPQQHKGAIADFVLYNDSGEHAVAAIWLQQPDNKQQAEQRRLVENSGIRVFQLQRKTSYSIMEIRNLLESLLKKNLPSPDELVATISMEALHLCRRCQSRMHIRRAASGPQKGTLFWVCEKYPACRQLELYIE